MKILTTNIHMYKPKGKISSRSSKKRKYDDISDSTGMRRQRIGSSLSSARTFKTKRSFDNAAQVSNASGPTFVAYDFSLANIYQSSEFTALFDAYRIRKIVVHFYPTVTQSTTSSANIGFLATAIDYDDANAPSSMSQVLQYENACVVPFYKEHHRKIYPRINQGALAGGTLNACVSGSGGQWLDIAYNNVSHFGLKIALSQSLGASDLFGFRVVFDYFLEFKCVR